MADGYVIDQEVYNGGPTWHGKNVTMAAPRRLRLAMLEHELNTATDGVYIVRPMPGRCPVLAGR